MSEDWVKRLGESKSAYVCNDTSNSGYGLVVSPRYASSGDRVYVNIYPGSISLAQRVSGVWSSLDSASVSSAQGAEYTIRVECDGQNVDVYRSSAGQLETKILETTACTVASTNYVSFSPSANADYSIDDIRILADGLSNTTTFAVNNANELASMTDRNGTTAFAFDDWGRMTSKSRASYAAAYAYRYGQMLRSVTSDFPGEGDVTYEYGGDKRSREATIVGTVIKYKWDSQSLINAEDASGVLTETYLGDLGHVIGSSPITGQYLYYSRDFLGSIRATRAANNSATGRWEFDPFGRGLSSSGPLGIDVFAGLRSQGPHGLLIAKHRLYDPNLTRWLTRDPLGLAVGQNLYAYANNNPVLYTDTDGLWGGIVVKIVVIGGIIVILWLGSRCLNAWEKWEEMKDQYLAIKHGYFPLDDIQNDLNPWTLPSGSNETEEAWNYLTNTPEFADMAKKCGGLATSWLTGGTLNGTEWLPPDDWGGGE